MQGKKNKENTKHCIKKSEKKNDEAKEKPINDIKHQSIPHKYGTDIIKKNIEEISGWKTGLSTRCLKALNDDILGR